MFRQATAAVALAAVAASGWVAERGVAAPAVGMVRRDFLDPARRSWLDSGPRPLVTIVFYPTLATAPAKQLTIGPPNTPFFMAGSVVPGAPIASTPARYPLILLSHGTGGSALQLAWLGTTLARKGYIVAAVNHHGNTLAEPRLDARGFILWWERARDLSVAIDRMLADSVFGPRIDPARIGVAGFSLGGYTALEIAGARTSLEAFAAFCTSPKRDATCDVQPEMPTAMQDFEKIAAGDSAARASLARVGASYGDPRVRAAVAISPPLGGALDSASLRAIVIPLLVIVGDSDKNAPPAANARAVAALVPGAQLTVLPRVGHYTMLGVCTDRGRQQLGALCADIAGVDRAAVHDSVSALALRFFDRTLLR